MYTLIKTKDIAVPFLNLLSRLTFIVPDKNILLHCFNKSTRLLTPDVLQDKITFVLTWDWNRPGSVNIAGLVWPSENNNVKVEWIDFFLNLFYLKQWLPTLLIFALLKKIKNNIKQCWLNICFTFVLKEQFIFLHEQTFMTFKILQSN